MTWAHYFFSYFIYLVAIDIKNFILCTHDLHAGTIGNNSGMQMFENEAYGQSSTMVTPFIQGGHANATMPMFANDVYGPSSNMSAPFIQGGLKPVRFG